jgi:hypothetical protein
MMGLQESKLPDTVRRRIKLTDENVENKIHEWILKFLTVGTKQVVISKAIGEATFEILSQAGVANDEDESTEVYLDLRKYIQEKYYEKMSNYYDRIIENDDNYTYCFYKHSERSGGGRGFGECLSGWKEFLSRFGGYLPEVNWNEVKTKLNELPNFQRILLAKPLEGHPYEYYFSISRGKN